MGVSPLMSIGVKAMTANYAALQTTGHNIANANVAGYSRQQVELATAQGQFSGAGFFGTGVDVVAVTRSHNEFLTREAASANSQAGMDNARLEQLRRIEGVFATGEAGLGHASSEFLNATVDMVNRPADLAARQVVLARADDLAARFDEAGKTFDESQASVNSELEATVAQVNSLAQSIAEVNQRIAALQGIGQPPNDLLDERERLVFELSQHVKVSRIEAPDGTLGIFIGGGQRLVLGTEAAKLQVVADGTDSSRSAVAIVDNGTVRTLSEDGLGGGSIAGLLRFQNHDLTDARNLVGRLAAALGGAVNNQQKLGLDLQSAEGADLFEMGSPLVLPHAANTVVRNVSLEIADPSALQPSDYELREDSDVAGSWQVTRLLDGVVLKPPIDVDGVITVDGMKINVGLLPPQAGDSFLLQPVARAANGMKTLFDDPRALAAATPPLGPNSTSDNTNALALLALRDAGLADGHTIVEAWSQAITDIGVRVQSARTSADISTTVAGQAEQARSSQAGVNLDEEAARLIQYQQSYQAAAKVLQVAQTLFDTLLQVAAGR